MLGSNCKNIGFEFHVESKRFRWNDYKVLGSLIKMASFYDSIFFFQGFLSIDIEAFHSQLQLRL